MTTWRKLIEYVLKSNKEEWADIVSIAPKDGKWLDYLFDDGCGDIEGESFTIWTKTRVYFPACFDGSEWVESLSRNPDDKATSHIGAQY